MDWIRFHHPDISWPVVRRRAGVEIMELLDLASIFFTHGGWGVVNRSCYPNREAFRNATSRLRRKGLIVDYIEVAKPPRLILSEMGKEVLPDYFNPEKMWGRKWNKIWYLLVYDVPEVDRKYRNILRQFLKRMRMGNLQQSVWVTPKDIRPEFDDLSKAASVGTFAYLFEARTVLGLPNRKVVEDAWNFDRLNELQECYSSVAEENTARLMERLHGVEELGALVRMSLDGYRGAFMEDPLLPADLHPAGYQGRRALAAHRKLFSEISRQAQGISLR